MKLLLQPGDYHTQKNNKWDDPETAHHEKYDACMPTARVMWYKANGIVIRWRNWNYLQPEDAFMALLNSRAAKKFCKEKYPWAGKTPPNQVHGMYGSWLDQRVTLKRRSDFRTDLTWNDYIDYLDRGHAIMTSGLFPGLPGGHAIVVIGHDEHDHMIIADPYGDYHTEYKSDKGYAVEMSKHDFYTMIRGEYYKKWGHVPI